jgi:hypothetical protein
MRKMMLCLLCCGSLLFGQEQIGDFAPIIVGNNWKYSFTEEHTPLDFPMSSDTARSETSFVSISVQAITTNGTDTIVQLSGTNSGKIIRTWFSTSGQQREFHDTITVAKSWVDSAIIRGDSIFRRAGYSAPVFPFYKKHSVLEASTIPGSVGGATELLIKDSVGSVLTSLVRSDTWCRNLGMIHSYNYVGYFAEYEKLIDLKEFNGQPIVIDASVQYQSSNSNYVCSGNSGFKVEVIHSRKTAGVSQGLYLVNGRCFKKGELLRSSMPIIIRIGR